MSTYQIHHHHDPNAVWVHVQHAVTVLLQPDLTQLNQASFTNAISVLAGSPDGVLATLLNSNRMFSVFAIRLMEIALLHQTVASTPGYSSGNVRKVVKLLMPLFLEDVQASELFMEKALQGSMRLDCIALALWCCPGRLLCLPSFPHAIHNIMTYLSQEESVLSNVEEIGSSLCMIAYAIVKELEYASPPPTFPYDIASLAAQAAVLSLQHIAEDVNFEEIMYALRSVLQFPDVIPAVQKHFGGLLKLCCNVSVTTTETEDEVDEHDAAKQVMIVLMQDFIAIVHQYFNTETLLIAFQYAVDEILTNPTDDIFVIELFDVMLNVIPTKVTPFVVDFMSSQPNLFATIAKVIPRELSTWIESIASDLSQHAFDDTKFTQFVRATAGLQFDTPSPLLLLWNKVLLSGSMYCPDLTASSLPHVASILAPYISRFSRDSNPEIRIQVLQCVSNYVNVVNVFSLESTREVFNTHEFEDSKPLDVLIAVVLERLSDVDAKVQEKAMHTVLSLLDAAFSLYGTVGSMELSLNVRKFVTAAREKEQSYSTHFTVFPKEVVQILGALLDVKDPTTLQTQLATVARQSILSASDSLTQRATEGETKRSLLSTSCITDWAITHIANCIVVEKGRLGSLHNVLEHLGNVIKILSKNSMVVEDVVENPIETGGCNFHYGHAEFFIRLLNEVERQTFLCAEGFTFEGESGPSTSGVPFSVTALQHWEANRKPTEAMWNSLRGHMLMASDAFSLCNEEMRASTIKHAWGRLNDMRAFAYSLEKKAISSRERLKVLEEMEKILLTSCRCLVEWGDADTIEGLMAWTNACARMVVGIDSKASLTDHPQVSNLIDSVQAFQHTASGAPEKAWQHLKNIFCMERICYVHITSLSTLSHLMAQNNITSGNGEGLKTWMSFMSNGAQESYLKRRSVLVQQNAGTGSPGGLTGESDDVRMIDRCLRWIQREFPRTPAPQQALSSARLMCEMGMTFLNLGSEEAWARAVDIINARNQAVVIPSLRVSHSLLQEIHSIAELMNNTVDKDSTILNPLVMNELTAPSFFSTGNLLRFAHITKSSEQSSSQLHMYLRHHTCTPTGFAPSVTFQEYESNPTHFDVTIRLEKSRKARQRNCFNLGRQFLKECPEVPQKALELARLDLQDGKVDTVVRSLSNVCKSEVSPSSRFNGSDIGCDALCMLLEVLQKPVVTDTLLHDIVQSFSRPHALPSPPPSDVNRLTVRSWISELARALFPRRREIHVAYVQSCSLETEGILRGAIHSHHSPAYHIGLTIDAYIVCLNSRRSESNDPEHQTYSLALGLLRWITDSATPAELIAEKTANILALAHSTWIDVIPQLTANLGHPQGAVQDLMFNILHNLVMSFPTFVVYPVVTGMNTTKGPKEKFAKLGEAFLQSPQVDVFTRTQEFITELSRIAESWDDRWVSFVHDHIPFLTKAIASYKAKKDLVKFASKMKKMELTFVGILNRTVRCKSECAHEKSFQDVFYVYLERCGMAIKQAVTSLPPEPTSQTAVDFAAFDHVLQLFNTLRANVNTFVQAKYPRRHIGVSQLSQKLIQVVEKGVPLPGQHDAVVQSSSIQSHMELLMTKTRPKRFCIVDSEGKSQSFLVKGKEDMHLDERVMQLLGIINRMLYSDDASVARSLNIQHYDVVPLADIGGLVRCVEGVSSLFTLRREHLKRRWTRSGKDMANLPLMGAVDQFQAKMLALGININTVPRSSWPIDTLKRAVRELMAETPRDLLARELWSRGTILSNSTVGSMLLDGGTPGLQGWYSRSKRFVSSLATMSIVGYVIGLGDRHLDNILIDFEIGDVVHIDYNVCFDKGKALRVPEVVPFRLTPMLMAAMGPMGVEGTYKISCECTLSVLRKHQSIIKGLLSAFVHDPLTEWSSSATGKKDVSEEQIAALKKSLLELRKKSLPLGGIKALTGLIQEHVTPVVNVLCAPARRSAFRKVSLATLEEETLEVTLFELESTLAALRHSQEAIQTELLGLQDSVENHRQLFFALSNKCHEDVLAYDRAIQHILTLGETSHLTPPQCVVLSPTSLEMILCNTRLQTGYESLTKEMSALATQGTTLRSKARLIQHVIRNADNVLNNEPFLSNFFLSQLASCLNTTPDQFRNASSLRQQVNSLTLLFSEETLETASSLRTAYLKTYQEATHAATMMRELSKASAQNTHFSLHTLDVSNRSLAAAACHKYVVSSQSKSVKLPALECTSSPRTYIVSKEGLDFETILSPSWLRAYDSSLAGSTLAATLMGGESVKRPLEMITLAQGIVDCVGKLYVALVQAQPKELARWHSELSFEKWGNQIESNLSVLLKECYDVSSSQVTLYAHQCHQWLLDDVKKRFQPTSLMGFCVPYEEHCNFLLLLRIVRFHFESLLDTTLLPCLQHIRYVVLKQCTEATLGNSLTGQYNAEHTKEITSYAEKVALTLMVARTQPVADALSSVKYYEGLERDIRMKGMPHFWMVVDEAVKQESRSCSSVVVAKLIYNVRQVTCEELTQLLKEIRGAYQSCQSIIENTCVIEETRAMELCQDNDSVVGELQAFVDARSQFLLSIERDIKAIDTFVRNQPYHDMGSVEVCTLKEQILRLLHDMETTTTRVDKTLQKDKTFSDQIIALEEQLE